MSAKKDSLKKRKLDWSLLLKDLRPELKQVAEILNYAAYEKPEPYGPRNWMQGINDKGFKYELENAIERHNDALMSGFTIDHESMKHHRAHIICSQLFLMGLERLERESETPLDSGDFKPKFNMIRGDEMPEWLVDMIKSNKKFSSNVRFITGLDWSDNSNFWLAVSEWQQGARDELPEEPK